MRYQECMRTLMSCLLSSLWLSLFGAAARADFMYYSTIGEESGRTVSYVRNTNLDGTNPQTVLSTMPPRFGGLDFVPNAGHLYVGNSNTGIISRSDLDGSNTTNLISSPGGVLDLEIDQVNGKIYWSAGTGGAGAVYRANLDGSDQQTLITGLNLTEGIALDPLGDRLYYTFNQGGVADIRVANLDGTNSSIFTSTSLGSGLFDVDFDPTTGYVYWNEPGAPDSIFRLLNTGGAVENIFTLAGMNNGLDFDPVDQTLYFSYGAGRMARINADGTGFTDVRQDLDGINYIRIMHQVNAVPEPSSLAMVGTGVLLLAGVALRRMATKSA